LVADITPPDRRGAAYGLRQSMDSVGAFAGPLIALGLMLAFGNDVRLVFWIAAVPAAMSVLIVALMIHEPTLHGVEHRRCEDSSLMSLGESLCHSDRLQNQWLAIQ
jgi:MFS family permease